MARPELSLVIPIYNEEEVLPQLDVRLKELLARLALDAEVVFVNDGSRDRSFELLRKMAEEEARYRVIVADSGKFNVTCTALICPFDEINLLITDKGATKAMLAPLLKLGVKVQTV